MPGAADHAAAVGWRRVVTPGELLTAAAVAVRGGADLDGARDLIADWLDATAADATIRRRIWVTTGQDDQTVAALGECHYRLPLAAARAVTGEVA